MKRVLQIMGGLRRGGLETFAMNMYRAIDRNQIQFDFLLTQEQNGDYEQEAKSLGARIYHLPARNKGYLAHKKALNDFFREHNEYIAVHMHASSLTSIDPLVYAKKYGIPIRILHSHSSSIQKSVRFHYVHMLIHHYNKLRVSKLATHYLGCSDKALNWMYKNTGIYSKAIMINNGIDTSQYSFNADVRAIIRKELGIDDDSIVVGHVGSFIPLKNQTFLVDVLNSLHLAKVKVKLLLVGAGPTFEEVKAKIHSLGLDDYAILTGVRSDVSRILQAMDVFVMPSWFEGLPVSLVEAQASGLPIVASSTISSDSDITGTIFFKSIEETPSDWASSILEWKNKICRPNNIDKIKLAGFDSKTTVDHLVNIYTGNSQ